MVFEILTFFFRGKNATVNHCLYEYKHHDEKMKELVYPPPNIVRG